MIKVIYTLYGDSYKLFEKLLYKDVIKNIMSNMICNTLWEFCINFRGKKYIRMLLKVSWVKWRTTLYGDFVYVVSKRFLKNNIWNFMSKIIYNTFWWFVYIILKDVIKNVIINMICITLGYIVFFLKIVT